MLSVNEEYCVSVFCCYILEFLFSIHDFVSHMILWWVWAQGKCIMAKTDLWE